MSLFKKAERSRAYLKIALTGPSGSGKSLSALLIASGLGEKIAVIDTECGSASLYSDKVHFDVAEMNAPFLTEKYIQAIRDAESAGYDVLVIDSYTHAWAGEGGLLQQKEELDQRGGNSFTNWAKITPKDNALRQAILQARIHIVVTMRSKQEVILVDRNGKSVPQKVGMAPIQRDGVEFEYTTVLDLAMNHQAAASKDRTGLFDGKLFTPSKQTGETLLAWLNGASAPEPEPPAPKQQAPRPQPKQAAPVAKPAPTPVAQPLNGTNGLHVIQGGQHRGLKIQDLVADIGPEAFKEYVGFLENNVNSAWATQLVVNGKRYLRELEQNHAEASESLFPNLNDSFDDVDTAYDAAKKVT